VNIDGVIRSHWLPPDPADRIESITQMREYVIIITASGRVWRAEDDPRPDCPRFSLVGHVT
jgi:hypothetical protein